MPEGIKRSANQKKKSFLQDVKRVFNPRSRTRCSKFYIWSLTLLSKSLEESLLSVQKKSFSSMNIVIPGLYSCKSHSFSLNTKLLSTFISNHLYSHNHKKTVMTQWGTDKKTNYFNSYILKAPSKQMWNV